MNALQRGFQEPSQLCGWLQKSFPLGEHEKRQAGHQVPVQLSHERAEYPLGSIASDCIPESLADDNPDSTGSIIHLIRQQIEQCCRDTSTMTFDPVDIPARS